MAAINNIPWLSMMTMKALISDSLFHSLQLIAIIKTYKRYDVWKILQIPQKLSLSHDMRTWAKNNM
jgi:hypothetical protein